MIIILHSAFLPNWCFGIQDLKFYILFWFCLWLKLYTKRTPHTSTNSLYKWTKILSLEIIIFDLKNDGILPADMFGGSDFWLEIIKISKKMVPHMKLKVVFIGEKSKHFFFLNSKWPTQKKFIFQNCQTFQPTV